MLLALNTIFTQQAEATETTNEAIDHLLEYLDTYPNNGILYRTRKVILAKHSYDGLYNESKVRSQSGYHIFLAED